MKTYYSKLYNAGGPVERLWVGAKEDELRDGIVVFIQGGTENIVVKPTDEDIKLFSRQKSSGRRQVNLVRRRGLDGYGAWELKFPKGLKLESPTTATTDDGYKPIPAGAFAYRGTDVAFQIHG